MAGPFERGLRPRNPRGEVSEGGRSPPPSVGMDYRGFLSEVERGNVPPIALLHGDEPRLLDDALAKVSRALYSDPSLLTLNREVFHGG